MPEGLVSMPKISNINSDWQEEESARGGTWKYRDLSGDRLGVRIEELSPGDTSSEHHFHTTEEEHVIVLEGSATLVLGADHHELDVDDHIWFQAGNEIAHHIKNNTKKSFKFLVFGERNPEDIVVYPEHQVMMVKSLGFKQFTYRNVPTKK